MPDDFWESSTFKSLSKEFGAEFCIPASEIDDRKRGIVKTLPSLDLCLSGGLQMGQMVQMAGPPKCGKTTLALEVAKRFLEDNPDKYVYYYKVEGRYSSSLAESIDGLDRTRLVVIKSTEKKILSGVDFLDIFEKMSRSFPGSMHILDSVGGLSSDLEMSNSIGDKQQGQLGALMAKFSRRNSGVIDVTNTLLVCINQIRDKMGYGSQGGKYSPGGKHFEHQISTDLWLSPAYPDKNIVDKAGNHIGHNVEVTVKTNAIGKPGTKTTLPLIYGSGFSEVHDIINLAEELEVIKKGGAWYTFGDEKFQGKENLINNFVENKENYEKLKEEVMSMVGGE